jgi:anaerobic selenocysteine-containing dehydrogenase/Fe-S-cluster-containing dehydrogenase component
MTQSEGSVKNAEQKNEQKGISRRRFLQVLGSGAAVGATTGCAERATQTIVPYVKGEAEQIPGVAVWFSSTCTECSAGCGIQVRTREGRAVKLEGNPDSPVNKGGLCALGQSAIQSHYDPDRIRQPLKAERTADSKTGKSEVVFKPISWSEALSTVSAALKDSAAKKAFIHGEMTGALDELTKSFSDAHNVDRITFDITQPTAVAKASELVYGVYGIPAYKIDKAEVVLNFGADFLETWVSPCEYSRDWADSRRTPAPVRVIHVEPRLSLTGANADTWLSAAPGTEVRVALAILKVLSENGSRLSALPSDVAAGIRQITAKVSLQDVAQESGVSAEKILIAAQRLADAHRSLVLAGGTAASAPNALSLLVVTNLLNLVLGNVGETVSIAGVRTPKSSPAKIAALLETVQKGEVKVLFMYNTNPAFTLPAGFGFDESALKKVPLVVSFASHLDESAKLADIIIPASSGLESWGDVRSAPGVYGLVQPTMKPVFDTKDIGDILLLLAQGTGNSAVAQGADNFYSYLKASWKKLQASLGVSGDAEKFWRESVERGGYFVKESSEKRAPRTSSQAFALSFTTADELKGDTLVLYPYLSVKTFDGRAANRPWLQELPDPITSVVWDSWAEIHPDTANKAGIKQGDTVTVRNTYGELNVPAYITEHVVKGVIAVPIGQGHKGYGRFASKVGGGNVLDLVKKRSVEELIAAGDSLPLLTGGVSLTRGIVPSTLVVTQETDNQGKGELARWKLLGTTGAAAATAHAGSHTGGGHGGGEGDHGAAAHADGAHGESGHHEVKQMYKQREHPLYNWGLNIDLAACTGCSACVVACYAENNIAVVGKELCSQGREMSWIRIERYIDKGPSEELQVQFLPMMCQHCHNAPCEPVCPVFATYHNDEGMNVMVYNRCVGTRYCSNNCSYKVRRFNWFDIEPASPLDWQLNPDVTRRSMGIMEKCTFCVQRILEAKDHAKDEGRLVIDGEVKPACVQSCPTKALTFGNLNDNESKINAVNTSERSYKVLDHHLNTQPAVTYLERVKYPA